MPKVNLGRDRERERQEAAATAARKIIKRCMAEQEINQSGLGVLLGVSQPVICSRLCRGGWSLEELVKLAKPLHLTAEDAAVILGIRT